MDVLKLALGNRGMTVEPARLYAKDTTVTVVSLLILLCPHLPPGHSKNSCPYRPPGHSN